MTAVYTIRDWSETFEHGTISKRPKKACPWFAHPTNLNGRGRLRLIRMGDEGFRTLAVFESLCALHASWDSERRTGRLVNSDGTPLELVDIADAIHIDEKTIENALTILSSSRIGWMTCEHIDDGFGTDTVQERSKSGPDTVQARTDVGPYRTGQDKTRQDRQGAASRADAADESKEPEAETEQPEDRCPYQDIVTAYNEAVDGSRWSKATRMTDELRRRIRARWTDAGRSLETMRAAFSVLRSCRFLREQKTGETGIGWILGPKNFTDVVNGKYGERPSIESDDDADEREAETLRQLRAQAPVMEAQ